MLFVYANCANVIILTFMGFVNCFDLIKIFDLPRYRNGCIIIIIIIIIVMISELAYTILRCMKYYGLPD